jgi:predicted kinase
MKTVIIMCGISGSGKSTRAAKFYPKAMVVSADHFFMVDGEYRFDPSKLPQAHGACLRNFVMCLQGDADMVVVDNTNTTVAEVAPYAALALAYGYDLKVEILKVDVETAAARNLHGVPKAGIVKMAERLEALKDSLPPWWPCEEV